MTKGTQIKRALALSTALSVVALGATTTTAEASLDPGKSQGKSQGHDKKPTPSKGSSDKGSSDKGSSTGSQGNSGGSEGNGPDKSEDHPSKNGQSNGNGPSQGGPPSDDGPKDKGDKDKGPKDEGDDKGGKGGDPAGNNGTVKITPHGEVDGIPQNTPHVGCDFDVEWYGFDEGPDIISTVTFEAWSPTRGTLEVVEGDLRVFVGGDPASGAGVGSDVDGPDADNGFDGEETYELAFPGIEPHPKQGYHVKLTINTPGSQGADVKHKVFWVEECEASQTPPVITDNPENPENPENAGNPETPEVAGEQGNDLETNLETDLEVLGEQGNVAPGGAEALPTAVDAGLRTAKWVASPTPLPLYVALFGAIVAGLGLLVRRRIS